MSVKDFISKYKIGLGVVGGAVVLSTTYGTCTFSPAPEEEASEEVAPDDVSEEAEASEEAPAEEAKEEAPAGEAPEEPAE